ncbi:S9 family peptidase [Candidatus Cloacimonadota bacterium]
MLRRTALIIITLIAFFQLFSKDYPEVVVKPDTTSIHGYTLIDNYSWLKDKSRVDPQVQEFLQRENEYTNQYMKSTQDLQQTLYDEFMSRTDHDDSSVPVKLDNYYYYSRTENGKDYNIFCRKKDSIEAEEEIYLDENILAEHTNYFNLYAIAVSPKHNLLAYSIDVTGFEDYSLYIKDLVSGKTSDIIAQKVDNIVWAEDNHTLLYSTLDKTGRTDKVFRYDIKSPKDRKLVFQESDGAFYIWLRKSPSDDYIYLVISSNTTSEVWFLESTRIQNDFKLIQKRQEGLEYYVNDYHDKFYIRTNINGARNFKIVTAPISDPGIKNWQEFISHRDSVYLDISVFEKFLVRFERYNGNRFITLTDHELSWSKTIPIPDTPYTISKGYNPNYNADVYRYILETTIVPRSVYEFDPFKENNQLLKIDKIRNYDPQLYTSRKIYAVAADGVQIPITITYRNDTLLEGGNPLLLNGYGAYGDSYDPYFSNSRLSLLDRGIIFATAHVRGGGEMGFQWYESGRMQNKKNTFTDFITCMEYLIDENYTSSDKMVIQGASAGGLLIGAVLNMRPDLCTAAVADVPFVDVLNSMLDPTLSATVLEYEEWGNPNIKEEFEYIFSYCPYQNIRSQNYPDILAIAGFYDSRVNYWEPAKWIMKIREFNKNNNIQLLSTLMDSGHSGTSGIYGYYHELAFKYAYIIDILKLNN